MACYHCRHFDERERPAFDVNDMIGGVRRTKGVCTLSPTWQGVTGLHYCSQFSPQSARSIGEFWRSMHESAVEVRKEYALRIAAERKLKELRKKIREAKNNK
jgi:hypothetical protein